MNKILRSPHKVFFYLGVLTFISLVFTQRTFNPEFTDTLLRICLASLATSLVSRFVFGPDPLVGEDP